METFDGRVAVVTGAASGIGAALAVRFAAEGMRLVLADVDTGRLADVAAALTASGTEVEAVTCDTADEADVGALARRTLDRFGTAHVVCANAGVAGVGDPWHGSMDLWHRVVGINLFGVVHTVRAFLPVLEAAGEGHVVTTASLAGLVATPGAGPYTATKHAVVGLTESLYLELRQRSSPVGVSVLCPAWVKTRIVEDPGADTTSEVARSMAAVVREVIEREGIAAEEVADQVVDAIRADRFWILTHPGTRELPAARMRRIVDGANPALRFP